MRTKARLPEGTYVELVRSLFSTLLTTAIMAVSFAGVGLLVSDQTPDDLLPLLTGMGCVAAAARLLVLIVYRAEACDERLTAPRARTLERRFAAAYLSFAAIFGVFLAHAFRIATPETHALLIGLLFGYGAGVAAGLSLRPWISVSAIVIAVVPTIVACLLSGRVSYWATGALLALFLFGAIHSMFARYNFTVRGITMRLLFQTLARHDPLTGLPNRLSLREQFGTAAAGRQSGTMIAVHCLDLDRFKPVNDIYGHPMGDTLLKAVAGRLTGVLRDGDFAARLGGDEFVVVQTGLRHASEAELLARRILKTVGHPYALEGHVISIGTSVGYALSPEHGTDLDRLAALADEALVEVKRTGGGIGAYASHAPDEQRLTA